MRKKKMTIGLYWEHVLYENFNEIIDFIEMPKKTKNILKKKCKNGDEPNRTPGLNYAKVALYH